MGIGRSDTAWVRFCRRKWNVVLCEQRHCFGKTAFPTLGVLQNATMSVAPLSINSDREEAVDFTKPFMTRYINVLMRLPRRETSYFEVSVTAAGVHYLISRYSDDLHQRPHEAVPPGDLLWNQCHSSDCVYHDVTWFMTTHVTWCNMTHDYTKQRPMLMV